MNERVNESALILSSIGSVFLKLVRYLVWVFQNIAIS